MMAVRTSSDDFLRQAAGPADSSEGEWLLFQRPASGPSGVYYPHIAKSMCTALDLAWKHVSLVLADPERARSVLAVQILHHVDGGEHNVRRLAMAATSDLLALIDGSDRRLLLDRSISAKARTKPSSAAARTLQA